jgi:quercetin dioxygenase-like cupin family protein
MAQAHAAPGEIIDVQPYGESLAHMSSLALFKSDGLEVLRMVLRAGRSVPQHHVDEEVTVLCLEGTLEFQAGERLQILQPAQMIWLMRNTPYAMRALSDASLLMTIVRRHAVGANNA